MGASRLGPPDTELLTLGAGVTFGAHHPTIAGSGSWQHASMDEDEFWRLADLAGQDAIEALVAELAGRGGAEIVAFHERLRTAMAALDTEEHRSQPVGDVHGGALFPPSEDTFEDLRAAVVASGREQWQAMVADPATLSRRWPLALGEEFAVAAAEAYELATGDPWPNLDLVTPHDPDAPGALPPATLQGWLMILIDEHSVPGGLPEAYLVQVRWLEQVLDVEEWWRRWNTARDRESQVDCYLDHGPDYGAGRAGRASTFVGTDFAGRDKVTVRVRLPLPSVERPDLDPAGDGTGWAALAREHVEALLDVLEAEFGMPRPVLPDPAELERRRVVEAAREAEDADGFEAWNLERTTRVPNIWAGRAPASAIDELVRTLENGGRVRLPAQLAAMRAEHQIPASAEDAEQLAAAGYSLEEIAKALG